ncbi:alpha/beta fold hydrolase [Phytohabitans sp. ZYX-F-186]|uniref:Alpha/beta fold hydrolase n=1 Tax=Phytohabitans maris TaxID=3071409 RepID=A0ABU0ZFK7_9ACTN|nr:alpha/beta fold hydrolase [Phytohabitans sp. ZYX-F-186]MDQ7905846.1 alpha/beta fold hydrolase [Phytohabitans sp. ZYX-F-186]
MPTEEYLQEHLDRGTDRIGLQVYPEPEGVQDAPVVVVWPAMGVRARYYRPLAASLRRAGLATVVVDLRGTGASTPPPSRSSGYGYAELAADVGAVQEALKPRLDGRRRLVLGHSLGGQAALLHLAARPGESSVDGVVLVAVGLPYWRSYPRRRYRLLAMTQAIGATSALLRVWPGWGFGGRQARGVMRDWAYTARTGRFPRLDGVDVESALREVGTPVLAISVDHDQFTPHETLDHLCAKLASAPLTRERHTIPGADHFTWARAADPLAARIADWSRSLPT